MSFSKHCSKKSPSHKTSVRFDTEFLELCSISPDPISPFFLNVIVKVEGALPLQENKLNMKSSCKIVTVLFNQHVVYIYHKWQQQKVTLVILLAREANHRNSHEDFNGDDSAAISLIYRRKDPQYPISSW